MTRALYLACPVVRGPGGIASYARRILETAAPQSVDVLSQGDEKVLFDLPPNARLLGVPRSQPEWAVRFSADYLRRGPTTFVLAHVGLTRPLALLPRQAKHRVSVILHGIEAWVPLSLQRAAGLRHVDSLVFTTVYSRELFLHWNRRWLRPDVETVVIPLSAEGALEGQRPFPTPTDARRRVVCVTRLTKDEPLKGVATLLEAARLLDPKAWEVVFVGEGDGRAAFEARAQELGITDRVRFTGWTDDATRTRLLSEADVFCLPSAQEGFGIVFLEAMVAGRPSVGAAAGAVPEVLPHEAGELFAYGDAVQLARAIERASRRLREGEMTPESIRGVYDERYRWELFAERWRDYLARQGQAGGGR